MQEPFTQRILDLIYQDPEVRRKSKDLLTDWILDTQSRTEPLDSTALLDYLAICQPHVFERLKINIRIQEDLVQAGLLVR
jgi:hypothetical protein